MVIPKLMGKFKMGRSKQIIGENNLFSRFKPEEEMQGIVI